MYKNYVMESPGKSDSDPDEPMKEDSRKSPSEESEQLEETDQKEDQKDGEAAESDPNAPEGTSPSKDSDKSTESESEKEKKKHKPGEVSEDEIKAPDGSILRRALTRPDEDSDSLSSDSIKSLSEESVQDRKQKEDHKEREENKEEREAEEISSDTTGGSTKDSDKSTESEESERKRKNVKPGEVTDDEKKTKDGSILRRALTRPDEDSDLSADSRKSSSETTQPEKVGEAAESDLDTLRGSSKDSDKSSESEESEKERKKVKPGEVMEDEKRAPDGSILRRALTRPEEDIDNLSIEVRVGDSRTPSEVPSPSEVRVEGDSSTTPPEAPSPIPIVPTGVVDSPILRGALTRPEDDVDKASIEVRVGDSRNPSEAPSPIEEIEELGQSEEASVQDLTSERPPGTSPPSEAGQGEPLSGPSEAQAVDTNPIEETVSIAVKYPILTSILEDTDVSNPKYVIDDSAVTTNETSIESISSTPPTSGDEIRNEGIIVEAQYILAPRRMPSSTDDTSSEENPDVPLPRPSPEVPEDIPVEENEPRSSSASSAVSTSSNSPNSTRSSGSSTNSTSSSTEEGGSSGHASGGSSPTEPTSTNRRSTDTRPDFPEDNKALPRILEATTEEEEAAAADSTPTTTGRILGDRQVHDEADSRVKNDESLTVTVTTSPSSIPPASSLTRSPVSEGTGAQISPALSSTVNPPRVSPMPALTTSVTEPLTSTITSCSPQSPIIPSNSSVSVPSSSSAGTAAITAPASSVSIPANESVSETSGSSTTTPSASSVSPLRSETTTSNPPLASLKRKVAPAVEPLLPLSPSSSSSIQNTLQSLPPQPISASGAPPPPAPRTPPAPPALPSPSTPAPTVQSPSQSPVPKKRQRQQYHEGAPPSAAVTLSGMPCIDPNELRQGASTPRQGTKRRISGSDEASVAGSSGSGHGGWRSKRSRDDEDDDIPELEINPRPPLEPPVHKISDDDSGAESGDDLGAVTPPNQGAASDDDDGIAGIVPLMPRRPPNQENGAAPDDLSP